MKHTPYFGTPPGVASAPLFGNPAISALLTRGFASQPHDWFAVIGEDSKSNGWNAVYASSMPEGLTVFKEIACPFFESDRAS